ncbi:hypothetical protein Rhe02_69240 [Rhizocola hellebori]|uniref:Uncharacterized protein n=1 Tax=Rhizocola hellebori TaxID=1392758 RepID=A0A8J3QFU6_9ACTN|nr:hypothetical protein Rhe02_69240 [Rhizocola hellebori]
MLARAVQAKAAVRKARAAVQAKAAVRKANAAVQAKAVRAALSAEGWRRSR